MEKIIALKNYSTHIKTYLIDVLLISFIYFLPALSHLAAFPIYFLDPMRIALVITLAHTSKRNSYLIALTLPLFSYLISSHPQVIKSILISSELLLNIALFFLFSSKIKNVFVSIFTSMVLSKVSYYAAKYFLINLGMINDSLISTPVYFQFAVIILLSIYLLIVNKKSKVIKNKV